MLEKIANQFAKVFGTKSEKDIKKLWPLVEEINEQAEEMKHLSDEELKGKTEKFKQEIKESTRETEGRIAELNRQLEQADESEEDLSIAERQQIAEELDQLDKQWHEELEDVLEDIMTEAFAVMKETCRRFVGTSWKVTDQETTWHMVPYDVQLLGAIVLHKGRIAEMKTGEGKTLVAIFPAYLNALAGQGVHIVTVNSYLAQRDTEWNRPLFEFHGLNVDCVDLYQPNTDARRQAYQADVTYGTNSEFGFDYLRDNMVINQNQLVQREHHYAIIDEVDSVLIDEARTPLIISGPVPQDNDTEKFTELKPKIEKLVEEQKKLVAGFLNEAEDALKREDYEKAGFRMLQAERGFPKSRKFAKLMEDPAMQKLVQQTEALYLQDQGKHMHLVDEELYYSVNQKQNTIELTENGRELITPESEDPEFFVLPDLGEKTSEVEEEFEEKQRQEVERIKSEYADRPEEREKVIAERKEDLSREKSEQLSELHRQFSEKSDRLHSVNQLLKAYTLFERDDEYIVQEGKVQIVDQHTGRVLPGRRFSDGLHQAIEAKENVKVESATQTYASITLQNFFRMYHKLAGMTGTAATEEGEFDEIYGLEVTVIPTNEPVRREDKEDMVFRTKREKYNAAIEKIKEYHQRGQPVLVGTTSVDVSETLSRMLKRSGIPHNVLNAKQHKKESQIVAEAGRQGAVTIATNMAGRGTDIKLGEGVKEKGGLAILGTERHESRRIDLQLRGRSGRQGDPGESQFYVSLEDDLMRIFGSDRVANVMDKLNFEEGEVITHPWVTKSLERAQTKVEQNNFSIRKRQLDFDDVLNSQRKVIYERRRNALLNDQLSTDIMNMLEDLVTSIVQEHYELGEYESIKEKVLRYLAVDVEIDKDRWAGLREDGVVDEIVQKALEVYRNKEQRIAAPFYQVLKRIHDSEAENKPSAVQVVFTDGTRRMRVVVNVDEAVRTEGRGVMTALEQTAVLSVIDQKWMEHLRELDSLKEGIGLRAFGQRDPLREYKREAYNLFRELVDEINTEIISMVWKSVPEVSADQQKMQQARDKDAGKRKLDLDKVQAQHQTTTNLGIKLGAQQGGSDQRNGGGQAVTAGDQQEKKQPVVAENKVGRNEPCPCGSGKKYKHCCYNA